MSDHSVTIEFEKDGTWPSLRFHCLAAQDAHCRNMCSRDECEEGCVDPDTHTREPLGYCNVVSWMENADEPGGCIPDRTDITVPIEIEWNDPYNGPDWRFAPAPNVDQSLLFEVRR